MKTDRQLQQDIMAELTREPAVQAEHIGVEVTDGVVTLSGHVQSYCEKWRAEESAQRVSGVNALAVEIDVQLPGTAQRADADIARTAENALLWTSILPKDAIKVLVEKGWVTLTGALDWDFQRKIAVNALRHLMGVTGVSDQIVITPTVPLSAVKADIEAALMRRAGNSARAISVEVQGGEVTLSGTVHSWSERDLATHAAWSTPGVRKVVDHTRLFY